MNYGEHEKYREPLRKALGAYIEAVEKNDDGLYPEDEEYHDSLITRTQLRSAARVLWFTDLEG